MDIPTKHWLTANIHRIWSRVELWRISWSRQCRRMWLSMIKDEDGFSVIMCVCIEVRPLTFDIKRSVFVVLQSQRWLVSIVGYAIIVMGCTIHTAWRVQSESGCRASSFVEFDLLKAQWWGNDDGTFLGKPFMKIPFNIAQQYTVPQLSDLSQKFLSAQNGRCVGQFSAAWNFIHCFGNDVFGGLRRQFLIHSVTLQKESTFQDLFCESRRQCRTLMIEGGWRTKSGILTWWLLRTLRCCSESFWPSIRNFRT